jgi:hypothetical protein
MARLIAKILLAIGLNKAQSSHNSEIWRSAKNHKFS